MFQWMANGLAGQLGACAAHHVTTARGHAHVLVPTLLLLMVDDIVLETILIKEFAIYALVQVNQ